MANLCVNLNLSCPCSFLLRPYYIRASEGQAVPELLLLAHRSSDVYQSVVGPS